MKELKQLQKIFNPYTNSSSSCCCFGSSSNADIDEIIFARMVIKIATMLANGNLVRNDDFIVYLSLEQEKSKPATDKTPLLNSPASPKSPASPVWLEAVTDTEERAGNFLIFIVSIYKFLSDHPNEIFSTDLASKIRNEFNNGPIDITSVELQLANQEFIKDAMSLMGTGFQQSLSINAKGLTSMNKSRGLGTAVATGPTGPADITATDAGAAPPLLERLPADSTEGAGVSDGLQSAGGTAAAPTSPAVTVAQPPRVDDRLTAASPISTSYANHQRAAAAARRAKQ